MTCPVVWLKPTRLSNVDRTDPDGPTLVQLVPTPEADMVPAARAAVDGLLESKILLAAEKKEIAHWCIAVGPAQRGVRDDSHAASEGDRVSSG